MTIARQYGEYGDSIQEFFTDKTFIRCLIGGRGSGKTAGLAGDITAHIWRNAGAKAIIARHTEESQADSSIDTFNRCFEEMGEFYSEKGPGLFRSWNNGRTFRVPSEKAVQRFQELAHKLTTRAEIAFWLKTEGDRLCGRIEFRGLPDADKGKFRGMECSYLALVEADQIAEKQFNLSLACLRWKGADPDTCDEKGFIKDRCVVLDTNPPGKRHWIALREEEQAKLPPEERTMKFWHLSTYENEHNLPENYIRDTILTPYANNPAMIQRMLYGQYADAYDGKPVFYSYQVGVHASHEPLPWTRGAYLILGWDFGTKNAVTMASYWTEKGEEYLHVLSESYLDGSDTDRQCIAALEMIDREVPFWRDPAFCAGILHYCDPAGVNSAFTKQIELNGKKVEQSAVNVMRTHGIYPGMRTTARGLQETIAIVNRFLAKRDKKGHPCFKIDTKGAPLLTQALEGGYRYPVVGEPGYGKDEPLKGDLCENLDHPADSFRYLCVNVLRLQNTGTAKHPFPNIPTLKRKNPNPTRVGR